ncbi:MAG TPA: dihydrolipoyllysine-residue succinyltransferase [Terriglobia bacterium]|nr:dihydrolipoyllysine-residue succinyltransferase [Terriglobia bacterium]
MPTNVVMPQMGESIAEGTITRWIKKVGERVERDEPLFEISTDKVDAEIPSPASGILTKILFKENDIVDVNTIVAEIDGEGSATGALAAAKPEEEAPAATEAPPSASSAPAAGQKIRSSPLVRKIAREHHVDLARVPGTGLGGRISKKDILVYMAQLGTGIAAGAAPVPTGVQPPPAAVAAEPQAPPQSSAPPPIIFTAPTQVVPMTAMRRQIAEHMVMSKRTSAHVATVFEVEMTRVAEVMSSNAAEFERRNGIKLTYTPFFVHAAVQALKQFPLANSSLDGENIIYKKDINIGIAVALETGLIVPVVKHADEKNFLGISRAVRDLAERARSKRLSVDDVQGGTFTITNPGIFGSLFGTPIINQPQVAIMGVGTIEKRPVVRNDAIAIRPMVYLSLSFDHRVLDGAVADQFMGSIKKALENWEESVL